jgi:aminoglycoside N3'-acetyltransferase
MLEVTHESLQNDLRKLGIAKGDTVLIRARLTDLGMKASEMLAGLLDSFLEVVGPDGTIVGLTFTKCFSLNKAPKDYVFDEKTPSTVGSLARLFLAHPQHVRSRHPVTSFAAIGANAERMCEGHAANAPCYLPIKTLLELDGKFLLIGCAGSSPGFTSVHWAQYELGLAEKSLLRNRQGVYYRKGAQIELYRRRDFGGCSRGFSKFYGHYVAAEKLAAGQVGLAYSLAIRARDAFNIEYDLLKRNPRFALCDDKDCFSCRCTWTYNLRDAPGWVVRRGIRQFRRLWSR